MKILLITALGIVFAATGFAQFEYDCTSTVVDSVHILSAGDISMLEHKAEALTNIGVEFHVATVGMGRYPNLDFIKKDMRNGCPSWQSPSEPDRLKSTLILFIVAPKEHKVGFYYGPAWNNALDANWNRIKTDYMVPHFRDRQWAAGLAAGMEQTGKRITASQDEAVHGATTVNQATDYSGLWQLLLILLGFAAFGLLVFSAIAVLHRRRKIQEAIQEAQQAAVLARNTIADKLSKIQQAQAEYEATDGKNKGQSKPLIDDALEQFGRLSNSSSTDPTVDGKSAAQYAAIGAAYEQLSSSISIARRWMSDAAPSTVPSSSDEQPAYKEPKRDRSIWGTTLAPSAAPQPVVVNDYRSSSGGSSDFTSGLVLGEVLSDRDRRRDDSFSPAPSVLSQTPTYMPTPSWSSSNDDDSKSSGGGSSSWSSDSSSSDSGGSSSWSDSSSSNSSSSDSGGGSSDW